MAQVKPGSKARPGRPAGGAREALVGAARELFIERDYDRVSTAQILARAGVSRGAMYHHFAGKRELYLAVWRESERALAERLVGVAAGADGPFEALRAGCLAYLDEAATSREMQRIGLLQSRRVLGWEAWRDEVAELGMLALSTAIGAAIEAGEMRPTEVEATAHLVLAALIEAGLLIATAADPAAARAAAEPVFAAMLDGLRG